MENSGPPGSTSSYSFYFVLIDILDQLNKTLFQDMLSLRTLLVIFFFFSFTLKKERRTGSNQVELYLIKVCCLKFR